MRKGLVFKKGIIFALAAAVVTSPAPVMGDYNGKNTQIFIDGLNKAY